MIRDDQIIVATDFNNIVDNEEDIETETIEGVDPANYDPKNNTKHKLPRTSPDEVASSNMSGQNEVQGWAMDMVMAVEIKVQIEVED